MRPGCTAAPRPACFSAMNSKALSGRLPHSAADAQSKTHTTTSTSAGIGIGIGSFNFCIRSESASSETSRSRSGFVCRLCLDPETACADLQRRSAGCRIYITQTTAVRFTSPLRGHPVNEFHRDTCACHSTRESCRNATFSVTPRGLSSCRRVGTPPDRGVCHKAWLCAQRFYHSAAVRWSLSC